MTRQEAIQAMIKAEWADYVDFDKLEFTSKSKTTGLMTEKGRGSWYISPLGVDYYPVTDNDLEYLIGKE